MIDKGKRITITNPEFLPILERFKDRKFAGTCANMTCNYRFTLTGNYVLSKMKPHIKECLKRKEKRGAYKWIEHVCKSCKKKFQWDIPIFIKVKGNLVIFNFELHTRKYLGPLDKNYPLLLLHTKKNGH